MPNVTEAIGAVVNLLLGVGLFIVIIRVSKLIEKITAILDEREKKD